MQIKLSLKLKSLIKGKFFFLISCLLMACQKPILEEEKYELPRGQYPKLVDVPERPLHPASSEVLQIQNTLENSYNLSIDAAKPPVS